MADVKIVKIDETRSRVTGDPGPIRELCDHLTFEVPSARYDSRYRSGRWDGRIRMVGSRDGSFYTGLAWRVRDFFVESGYKVEMSSAFIDTEVSLVEAAEWTASILPSGLIARDFQVRALALAARRSRRVFLSPTGSGKSLIAYLLHRWNLMRWGKKTLLVVPTINLVSQMRGDFVDYGYDTGSIHMISGGSEILARAPIDISTWQSIYKIEDPSFFDRYSMVIGDEAHLFKAKSLTSLMEGMRNTPAKIAMTGTLDGKTVHELTIEGLFGPIETLATTRELQEREVLADLKINVVVLKHPVKSAPDDYQDEIEYICASEPRNKFLRNLALSLKGNTMVLFERVEKHGKRLHEMISEKTEEPVFFIHGGVDAIERELARAAATRSSNVRYVASYGTFSVGANIPHLDNIIFAGPFKSVVRLLQSIGRELRRPDGKTIARLFDVADDIGGTNYGLRHLQERVKIYSREGFKYAIAGVKLNG